MFIRPRECPYKNKKSKKYKKVIEEDIKIEQMNFEKDDLLRNIIEENKKSFPVLEDDWCKITKDIMKYIATEFNNILNSYSKILKKVKKKEECYLCKTLKTRFEKMFQNSSKSLKDDVIKMRDKLIKLEEKIKEEIKITKILENLK